MTTAVVPAYLPRTPSDVGNVGNVRGQVANKTCLAGASIAILFGAVVLAGWTLAAPLLTTIVPGTRATQPLTAVCLILSGFALIGLRQSRGWRMGAFWALALVGLISIQALFQHFTGTDLGTDRLLFATRVATQPFSYAHPGRPAAPTATAFILVSGAACLARANSRAMGLAYSILATAVVLLVAITLLSDLFHVVQLTGPLAFTQVGIPTALGLGGLSVSLLALHPNVGWVRHLVGEKVGAVAARWLLPVVILCPVAVAWVAFQGNQAGFYSSAFSLALTTVVTIVLLAGFTLRVASQIDRLSALQGQLLHAQEEERRRMARDLHDSASQLLVALQLNLLQIKLERAGPNLDKLLADCSTLLDQIQNEIRTFSFIHHPPSLAIEGIGKALEKLAAGFAKRSGLGVETFINEIREPSRNVEATLYRIAQEALANIHRHAGATLVKLWLAGRDSFIDLTIEDDGIGFDLDVSTAPTPLGVGITGMKERVAELGGSLSIRKLKKGSSVTVSLPYIG